MIELRLLGQFDLKVDGQSVEITSTPAQTLLAYLALNPDVEHHREMLGSMMWPDAYDEASARNNLKQALYRLRQALPEDALYTDKTSIGLAENAELWSDVAVLEAAVDEMASADDLQTIVGVYQGELLPGFKDDWIDRERVRLHTVFEQRMRHFILLLTGERRWHDVLRWAEEWIALGLAPEPAYRALMRAHAALGDRASMAAVYRRCERDMADLIQEPSPETKRLYKELANQTGQADSDESDTAEREDAQDKVPTPTTPLIGRERELAEAQKLLDDPYCRLLTLVGPGGIGKTRLAQEIALSRIGQYRDGVIFVSLAPIEVEKLIAPAIGDAMSVGFHDTSDPLTQLKLHLADKQMLIVLDNFEHLLGAVNVLPKIIEQSPNVTFIVTSRELLNLQGEFYLPITGLQIGNEVNTDSAVDLFLTYAQRAAPGYEIQAQDLPHIVNICSYLEGMPLAIELAASWVKMLSAEEIAAEIQHNIDFLQAKGRDARHRSMRAVFNHSWGRLTADEQQVLELCSLFRGGFTREAAREVAGASLTALMSLIDKSLMRHEEQTGRYAIHEMLRQFAYEELGRNLDQLAAAQAGHAAYFTDFLRAQNPLLRGPAIADALQAISLDRDNIRMALDWIAANRALDLLDSTLVSMWTYFAVHGPIVEAQDLFEQIAGQFETLDDPTAQQATAAFMDFAVEVDHRDTGMVLLQRVTEADACRQLDMFFPVLIDVAQEFLKPTEAAGWLDTAAAYAREVGDACQLGATLYIVGHHWLYTQKNPGAAHAYLEESLTLLDQQQERFWRIRVLTTLGDLSRLRGEYEQARSYLEDSIALAQEMGGEGLIAWNYLLLGRVSAAQGEYREAQRLLDRYVGDFRELRLRSMRASTMFVAAQIAALVGDFNKAREQLEGSYQSKHADPILQVNYLSTKGNLAHARGQVEDAGKYLHEALELALEAQYDVGTQAIYKFLGNLALDTGTPDEALAYMQESLRTSLKIGLLPEVLNTLSGLASVLAKIGEPETALQLVTVIIRHRATDAATTERALDLLMKLKQELPPDRVMVLQDEILALELDEIVGQVLSDVEAG